MPSSERTLNATSDCKVCKISQRIIKPYVGGPVIELDGKWTLNHYGGEEGFLGWLALQPYRHVANFAELNECESGALGPNLRRTEGALRDYWAEHFRDDPIERLYALCFSEYSQGHFHFHLVPRTRKLGDLLRYRGDIVAWAMPIIGGSAFFPKEYVVHPNNHNENVENLMEGLQRSILEPTKTISKS